MFACDQYLDSDGFFLVNLNMFTPCIQNSGESIHEHIKIVVH